VIIAKLLIERMNFYSMKIVLNLLLNKGS